MEKGMDTGTKPDEIKRIENNLSEELLDEFSELFRRLDGRCRQPARKVEARGREGRYQRLLRAVPSVHEVSGLGLTEQQRKG
jgi:hypothetical protein